MTIETLGIFVERQFSCTARGVMDIIPRERFYIYIAELKARPVNLPKITIVAMLQVPAHAPYIQEMSATHAGKYGHKFNSNPPIKVVKFKPLDPQDEQVRSHNVFEESNDAWKTEWLGDLTLRDEYSAYHNKLATCL